MVALAEMRSRSGLPKAESTYMLHMWKTIWNEQPENTLEELHKNMGGARSVEAETRKASRFRKPQRHLESNRWKEGRGKSGMSAKQMQQQNEAAFNAFNSNSLDTCPHCGRTFLAERLEKHLLSCKPGNIMERS